MAAQAESAATTTVMPPDVRQLLDRAQRGDQEVLPLLRQFLDDSPQVWRRVGDLAQHARLNLLRELAANDLLVQESVTRQLDALKAELAEPEDSPIHRLLVERVVLGWLEVHCLDCRCRTLREQFSAPAQVDALERRRTSSQRRYLAALRSLSTVRKLLRKAPSPVEIASRLQSRSNMPRHTSARASAEYAGSGKLN